MLHSDSLNILTSGGAKVLDEVRLADNRLRLYYGWQSYSERENGGMWRSCSVCMLWSGYAQVFLDTARALVVSHIERVIAAVGDALNLRSR